MIQGRIQDFVFGDEIREVSGDRLGPQRIQGPDRGTKRRIQDRALIGVPRGEAPRKLTGYHYFEAF